ncbi:MAG: pyridoxal phosphate-dependent aminotransferase [Bacteroidota bacterium]|nr:pyridoxal phosphate-dependent aminotransferase [Bacteroidota bacterium]
MELKMKPESVFNELADIGVIWVIDEAAKLGFYNGNPEWANLGQGEPEVGKLAGGAERIEGFTIEPNDDRYGPTNGIEVLRKTIADHYNRLYRKDKTSKYTANNVSIAMGGRLALTRIFAILGKIRLGYKTPEYPAYHDMLNYQLDRITPVYLPSKKENNHSISSAKFVEAIKEYDLDAFLFSNPCNPTGHVLKGEELKAYLKIAKEENCTLIIDEFYSHFIYENGNPASEAVSSAAFIEDVNTDPVLIVDGLTKSFRYPGWRLAWILGPSAVIENLGRAASAIDGGPSVPIQRATLQLFEPEYVDTDTKALREVFSRKHNIMLNTLRKNGMSCSADANSTFYIWADISKLPSPLNDSISFFKEALKHKVITVPGYMFGIHPGQEKKRPEFNQYIRFSFGPTEENMKMGLARISELIKSYS